MSELYKLGIKAAAEGLSRKDFSSVELTQAIIDRVQGGDGEIGAYLTLDRKSVV